MQYLSKSLAIKKKDILKSIKTSKILICSNKWVTISLKFVK